MLRQAGLVATRRDGQVFYRLAGTDVAALYAHLRASPQAHLAEAEARPASPTSAATTSRRSTATSCCAALEAGDVVVLDVRPAEEYAAGHIPGAVSIPVDELADRLAELPADVEIVAYCRGAYCVLAHEAVRLLREQGRPARKLVGGMLEWRLADLRSPPARPERRPPTTERSPR